MRFPYNSKKKSSLLLLLLLLLLLFVVVVVVPLFSKRERHTKMGRVWLLALLLCCCLCFVSSTPISPSFQTDFQTDVLHVTNEKNFAKVSKHLDFRWLILFYRPNHDLSASLQEVFLEARRQLGGGELQFAAVNCGASTSLCKRLKIRLFPSLQYFREGEGVEVYLRTLSEFEEFTEKIKLPDFWVASGSDSLGNAFEKAHYLHPSGGVSFFYIPASPNFSLASPSSSFLAFSYQASLWKHTMNFCLAIEGANEELEEEAEAEEAEESGGSEEEAVDLRTALLSLLSEDGVIAPMEEDLLLVVRGPESISVLELDFFEDEVEEEFFSSTTTTLSIASEENEEIQQEEEKEAEDRLESLLRLTEQERKKKEAEEELEQVLLRKKKRLLGERNKKALGGWVESHRYRIVERLQPASASDLILKPGTLCCITFVGDLNSTAELSVAEKRLQTIERAILESGDLPDELTFAYAFISDYPQLSKKNGVRDMSKLPMTVLVDAHGAKHALFPDFTESQEQNIQIILNFLEELQKGEVRFLPSFFGTVDGLKYLALKTKDFVLGQPPVEFVVGLVVVAAGFVYYLCKNYEDMSEREAIVREIIRKREEEERKKQEEELLKIIEEEEKHIEELMKSRKKTKQDKKEEKQDIMKQLKDLIEMKNQGELTAEEFSQAKEALFKSK